VERKEMDRSQIDKVTIVIGCPKYPGDAKSFPFERRSVTYEAKWNYRPVAVMLYLREHSRLRYIKRLICPECGAELLLCVDHLQKIELYQFAGNKVAHYIDHSGEVRAGVYRFIYTNCLYLKPDGQLLDGAAEVDAKSVPKDYLPVHPEIFDDEWKVKDLRALQRIEDLSDDEIAILLVEKPEQTIALLNDAKTGREIAGRILIRIAESYIHNVYKVPLRPIPDRGELFSAISAFTVEYTSSNFSNALVDCFDSGVTALYFQILASGICCFLVPFLLWVLIGFPKNLVSLLAIGLSTPIVLVLYSDNLKRDIRWWQSMIKWLPENRRIKHTKIAATIFLLAQTALTVAIVLSCVYRK
jgi:hypothetical protein